MPIKIPSSLDEIDRVIAEGANGKQDQVNFSLQSMKVLQEKPMLESALIQWIFTMWRHAIKDGFLIDSGHEVKNEMALLERLATSVPGAVLALLPHGKVLAVDRKQSAIFRDKLLGNQRYWPDLAVTSSASIICLDAHPRLLPPQLYLQGEVPKLIDWYGYEALLDKLIRSVSGEHRIRTQILGMSKNICEIFYELFKNTHDHARSGVDNQDLSDSVRGVYMRFFPVETLKSLTEQSMEEELARNTLENYLAALVGRHFRKATLRSKEEGLSGFLELSVFDSGPGLAAKWMKRAVSDVDGQKQYEAVLKCFTKGASSTTDESRGYGLWKVLKSLGHVKGCIRIRTNKVHLFREFGRDFFGRTEQMPGGPEIPSTKLFDWGKMGLVEDIGVYPSIEGTLISIMLPLEEA